MIPIPADPTCGVGSDPEREDPPAVASPGAEAFQQTRNARRSEVAEDYVELIAELTATRGEARLVDIAAHLGVKPATASKIVGRLRKDGLLVQQPYRGIFLTESGRQLARTCGRRHRLVVDFLVALGVDLLTAQRDAEGIEHHASPRTLDAFAHFVERGRRGQTD